MSFLLSHMSLNPILKKVLNALSKLGIFNLPSLPTPPTFREFGELVGM